LKEWYSIMVTRDFTAEHVLDLPNAVIFQNYAYVKRGM
jgi:hypothetical protein